MMRHGLVIDDVMHEAALTPAPGGYWLHGLGEPVFIACEAETTGALALLIDREEVEARYAILGDDLFLHVDGRAYHVRHVDPVRRHQDAQTSEAQAAARAPMPGTVVRVITAEGTAVAAGDPLLVIESMKLETTIRAWRDGIVARVHVAEGQSFERDVVLVSLAEEN